MSKFAERLNALMKSEHLTTTDLKNRVGISTAQGGRYLSGHYVPSLANALKLCSYFECSLDYLLGTSEMQNEFQKFNKPDFNKFIDRYQSLLKSNNTSHNRVCIDNKINRNNLIYWQRHKSLPTLDILYKLASYLHSSVEYLTGRVD